MRVSKENIDIKMQVPAAVIRQHKNFGDATGLGKISGSTSLCLLASTQHRYFKD